MAQVPSLMLSIATAVIVTRVSKSTDMGKQLVGQLFGQPRALAVAGVVLGVMGLIPGMPNIAFLLLGGTCGGAAWLMIKREREAKEQVAKAAAELPAPAAPVERLELGWEDVASVDPLGLEVGYRLIPLVDTHQGGELMGRIKSVRRKLSQELGFLVPAVHIRDNLDLGPNTYRITLMGVLVAVLIVMTLQQAGVPSAPLVVLPLLILPLNTEITEFSFELIAVPAEWMSVFTKVT